MYNHWITDSQKRPGVQHSLRTDYNVSTASAPSCARRTTAPTTRGPTSAVNRFPWMADADIDYILGGHNHGGHADMDREPDHRQRNDRICALDGGSSYRDEWLSKLQKDQLASTCRSSFGPEPAERHSGPDFGANEHRSKCGDRPLEGRLLMENIADSVDHQQQFDQGLNAHQIKTGVAFEFVHYLFTALRSQRRLVGELQFLS